MAESLEDKMSPEVITVWIVEHFVAKEQIRAGVSNRRNKVLAEHAAHILPYRGLGTGIPRALDAWPKIDLIDERAANQFRAVVWRPTVDQSTRQVTGQVTGQVMRLLSVIGRDILQRQAAQGWGSKVIERLAHDLRVAFPSMKGFSRANLMYMRAFAEAWPDAEIVQQAVGQL